MKLGPATDASSALVVSDLFYSRGDVRLGHFGDRREKKICVKTDTLDDPTTAHTQQGFQRRRVQQSGVE